ncbi:hypothetical protein [Streptomyces virginiae]|uniref:hypothetical protein n=1 Tax=Streptomyces virginiae TaxID=1961 RepID=UPI00224C98B7|nr:hypothetical protein [Streptomyces virginiae]MCX5277610.1 serine/threonine-protein phosphatase [Streptomyces virginiae]
MKERRTRIVLRQRQRRQRMRRLMWRVIGSDRPRCRRRLLDQGRHSFATGQMLRISLDGSGTRLVNAGHPWPLRLRDGAVDELRLSVDPSCSPPMVCRNAKPKHPREVVRALVAAVTDAYGGRPPRDDATVLCLDRYGSPSGRGRANA